MISNLQEVFRHLVLTVFTNIVTEHVRQLEGVVIAQVRPRVHVSQLLNIEATLTRCCLTNELVVQGFALLVTQLLAMLTFEFIDQFVGCVFDAIEVLGLIKQTTSQALGDFVHRRKRTILEVVPQTFDRRVTRTDDCQLVVNPRQVTWNDVRQRLASQVRKRYSVLRPHQVSFTQLTVHHVGR
ncbi:hypothetical protein D3C80_49640 [compost metagenome]